MKSVDLTDNSGIFYYLPKKLTENPTKYMNDNILTGKTMTLMPSFHTEVFIYSEDLIPTDTVAEGTRYSHLTQKL